MLSSLQRLFSKLGVCVVSSAHNHQLDISIAKEGLGCSVVLDIGMVYSAMLATFDFRLVLWRFSSLQEGVDFEIWVREDERKVEDLDR